MAEGGIVTATRRAPPNIDLDARHRWAVRPALQWSIPPGIESRRCRFGAGGDRLSCGAPAVAMLRRGRVQITLWAYCADHLYGRWIEAGEVLEWRAIRRGY